MSYDGGNYFNGALTRNPRASIECPIVDSISPPKLNHAATLDLTITGYYFQDTSTVSIVGQTVNSVTFVSPNELTVNVTSNSTDGLYDVIVGNDCGLKNIVDGIEVKLSVWFDMRVAADLTAANITATTGLTYASTANGLQVTPATTSWNQALKFEGAQGSVSDDFQMVVYRTGTARRFMPGLFNQATDITTWPGGNSYQRQYCGAWQSGPSFSTIYGSQLNEGGVGWTQNIGATVNTPTGQYTLYKWRSAGQNGSVCEAWVSDVNLNEITLLHSWTSNKTATPATIVI